MFNGKLALLAIPVRGLSCLDKHNANLLHIGYDPNQSKIVFSFNENKHQISNFEKGKLYVSEMNPSPGEFCELIAKLRNTLRFPHLPKNLDAVISHYMPRNAKPYKSGGFEFGVEDAEYHGVLYGFEDWCNSHDVCNEVHSLDLHVEFCAKVMDRVEQKTQFFKKEEVIDLGSSEMIRRQFEIHTDNVYIKPLVLQLILYENKPNAKTPVNPFFLYQSDNINLKVVDIIGPERCDKITSEIDFSKRKFIIFKNGDKLFKFEEEKPRTILNHLMLSIKELGNSEHSNSNNSLENLSW